MPHALTPRPINAGKFATYTDDWRKLIDNPDADIAALQACFVSNEEPLNYLFLTNELVVGLLAAGSTAEIRTKFVLVPRETDGTPVFTMAFYGIDRNQIPTTPYYLAGVAGVKAELSQSLIDEIKSQIPFEKAYTWIKRWNNLTREQVRFELFKTIDGYLRGYTHDLQDFKKANGLPTAPGNGTPALWLNFALPDYRTAELFGTVLTRNSEPDPDTAGTLRLASDEFYFDISRPCPPAC